MDTNYHQDMSPYGVPNLADVGVQNPIMAQQPLDDMVYHDAGNEYQGSAQAMTYSQQHLQTIARPMPMPMPQSQPPPPVQQVTNIPPNSTRPTLSGLMIKDTEDACIALMAVYEGYAPYITKRPEDKESELLVQSGNVIVYCEEDSGIKRWTDPCNWSPSRILHDNFLVYRELSQPKAAASKAKAEKKGAAAKAGPGPIRTQGRKGRQHSVSPGEGGAATRHNGRKKRQVEGTLDDTIDQNLAGALFDDPDAKPGGLIKKCSKFVVGGKTHHVVAYYSMEHGRQMWADVTASPMGQKRYNPNCPYRYTKIDERLIDLKKLKNPHAPHKVILPEEEDLPAHYAQQQQIQLRSLEQNYDGLPLNNNHLLSMAAYPPPPQRPSFALDMQHQHQPTYQQHGLPHRPASMAMQQPRYLTPPTPIDVQQHHFAQQQHTSPPMPLQQPAYIHPTPPHQTPLEMPHHGFMQQQTPNQQQQQLVPMLNYPPLFHQTPAQDQEENPQQAAYTYYPDPAFGGDDLGFRLNQ